MKHEVTNNPSSWVHMLYNSNHKLKGGNASIWNGRWMYLHLCNRNWKLHIGKLCLLETLLPPLLKANLLYAGLLSPFLLLDFRKSFLEWMVNRIVSTELTFFSIGSVVNRSQNYICKVRKPFPVHTQALILSMTHSALSFPSLVCEFSDLHCFCLFAWILFVWLVG